MATGESVVQVLRVMPPAATAAPAAWLVGGSTPAESVQVWKFVDASDTFLDFLCKLHGYDNGGLTFTLPWCTDTVTTNEVRWGIAIRRFADDAEDLDGAHTYDFNEVDDTAPSAARELSYPTVTFTNGADMDSWVDGELAIVRVFRNGDHANDDLADSAFLWALIGNET